MNRICSFKKVLTELLVVQWQKKVPLNYWWCSLQCTHEPDSKFYECFYVHSVKRQTNGNKSSNFKQYLKKNFLVFCKRKKWIPFSSDIRESDWMSWQYYRTKQPWRGWRHITTWCVGADNDLASLLGQKPYWPGSKAPYHFQIEPWADSDTGNNITIGSLSELANDTPMPGSGSTSKRQVKYGLKIGMQSS
jgi:hypothetical protein